MVAILREKTGHQLEDPTLQHLPALLSQDVKLLLGFDKAGVRLLLDQSVQSGVWLELESLRGYFLEN